MCNQVCKLCNRLIISQSVTVCGSSLVINIPAGTYLNMNDYCIVIAQLIPSTATVNMPVFVTIGSDANTMYPLLRCNGTQVTARQLTDRIKLKVRVGTSATSGVFRVLYGLIDCPNDSLASLPVDTATSTPTPTNFNGRRVKVKEVTLGGENNE